MFDDVNHCFDYQDFKFDYVAKYFCKISINKHLFFVLFLTQVCDSDTMLDPASSVEMVKVLEEDPMVGGVGGDVQVSSMFFG